MGVALGIDIGISTTKVVLSSSVEEAASSAKIVLSAAVSGDKRLKMLQFKTAARSDLSGSLSKAIEKLLRDNNLTKSDVSNIYLTGVGASFLNEPLLGINTQKVSEFEAIHRGALRLSGLNEALIISMGTGTAFVKARASETLHIGGTGIGGGTILGLASILIDGADIDKVLELAAHGKASKVDLLIKDILNDTIDTLPPDLTASNFGKFDSSANDADIALGIVNMVFESIGMMALFALRGDDINDIVLIGTLATFPYARTVFDKFAKLTGKNFIIPPDAAFITAIGTLPL